MERHRSDKLRAALILVALAGLLITGCTAPPQPQAALVHSSIRRETSPDSPVPYQARLEAGNTAFALDLYRNLAGGQSNLFYSPYSISLALAMTYAGARGETEAQMARALHFTLPQADLHPAINALDLELARRASQTSNGMYLTPEPGEEPVEFFRLNIANSLWGQKDFNFLPDFLDRLAVNYGAGIRLVDFYSAPEPSRLAINDWVSEQTEGKIKDLIPPNVINEMTRLVLANAIYFNAHWRYPFSPDVTRKAPFYLVDGSQVEVDRMKSSSFEFLPYVQGPGYQAVAFPYVGEEVSMVILLPAPGQFTAFEAGLNAQRLNEILSAMQSNQVKLSLPKFKFESSYALKPVLEKMGMPDAFDPERADFSGMTGGRDLLISKVLHKAYIAVDEKGTEAAAATAVILVPVMGISASQEIELVIDRPFIFLIRDEPTGAILFVGRVLDPGSN
jgi:serpin B